MAQRPSVQFHSQGFYFIGVGTLLVMAALLIGGLSERLYHVVGDAGLLSLVFGNMRVWIDRRHALGKKK